MEEEQSFDENYIFFLRLSSELPDYFYKISEFLNEWGIALIPVTPKELLSYAKGQRKLVLNISDKLGTYKSFLGVRKTYLDFALKSNKLFLVDISSFSQIALNYKIKNKGNYIYIKLPVCMKFLAKTIAYHFYRENEFVKRWPGGKQAQLPKGGV